MKNKFKGFTLVELIVVMALISVIMLGVMQLFQPIRTVYVDAVQYESQRAAQNGVVKYITESVRFSTDMGIYSNDRGVPSAKDATDEFIEQYCISNGIIDKDSKNPVAPYDSTEVHAIQNEIKKYAEIIIIANDKSNAHTYRGKTYTGRLIRRKGVGTTATIPSDPALTSSAYTDDWRIAMSEAYYGENTFSINLTVTDDDSDGISDDGMLSVSVSSSRNGKRDISNESKKDDSGKKLDATKATPNINRGGVLCRNLVSGGNGVNDAGLFDVSKYNTPVSGTKSIPGSSATAGKKTYIIFLNNDGKESVNTVVDAAKATP